MNVRIKSSWSRWFSLSCCAALLACEAAPDASAPERVSSPISVVQVQTLRAVNNASKIVSFGVVEALEEVDVAAELTGTVKAVYVNEGDRVETGQLLLELDAEKRELVLRRTRQAAEQARAALDEARLKLNRRRDLAERDTISQEVLDNAGLAVQSAQANYQAAVAAMHLAERELADTRILSPTAGLVDVKAVEPGEAVAAGATLIKLQAVAVMRVHTWVSEADVRQLRAGGEAVVRLSGLAGQELQAVVEWVGVKADSQTGNFPVKLILQQASDAVRPGMTATATIIGLQRNDVLLLPELALVDHNRRRVVFVVEEGIARLREPSLAAGFSNRLQVLAGLEEGDVVVVAGHRALIDGAPVSILGTAAAP
jgi:RND family efflux transporter MFP subunit